MLYPFIDIWGKMANLFLPSMAVLVNQFYCGCMTIQRKYMQYPDAQIDPYHFQHV